MPIKEAYDLLLQASGFNREEVEDLKQVRCNTEPRDVICILLDAYGFCVSEIASLFGVHPNTVYQALNREHACRALSRSVYFTVLRDYGEICSDCSDQDRIRQALSELGLTEEQVFFGNHQGKKNHKIHAISLLYRHLKGKVSMKAIEDFTGTSHTAIHKYLKEVSCEGGLSFSWAQGREPKKQAIQ